MENWHYILFKTRSNKSFSSKKICLDINKCVTDNPLLLDGKVLPWNLPTCNQPIYQQVIENLRKFIIAPLENKKMFISNIILSKKKK